MTSSFGIKIKALSTVLNRTIQDKLRLGAAKAPEYLNHVKDEIIYKRVSEANHWYTKILGLDEVKFHQQRVMLLQEKLLDVQEKRRQIGHQLSEIRKVSNDLQEKLHKVKRQDDLQRFLDLMKEETETLKQELEISSKFNTYDREEREIFTAYTNAVKDSHEKQRAQLEYTKYFGIILSILGSFFTFCYSTLRKRDLKRYIDERLDINSKGDTTPVLMQLHSNQKQINALSNYMWNDKDLRSLIVKNQNELMAMLDNEGALNAVNKNHRELMSMFRSVMKDKTQELSAEMEMNGKPSYLVLGSIALCGYIVLKFIIG